MENIIQLPIIGQIYNYFDDGKIRESRREEVIIKEVIPFSEIDLDTLEMWKEEIEERDWLYEKETDYFIKAIDENNNIDLVFVRSKFGWFSFGSFLGDGRLDIDGSLTKSLLTK